MRPRLLISLLGAYVIVAAAAAVAVRRVDERAAEGRGLQLTFAAHSDEGTPVRFECVTPAIDLAFLDEHRELPMRFFSVTWRGFWYLPVYQSVWTTLHGMAWSDMSFFSNPTRGGIDRVYVWRGVPLWLTSSVLVLGLIPNLLAVAGALATLGRRALLPLLLTSVTTFGVYVYWFTAQEAWALKTKYNPVPAPGLRDLRDARSSMAAPVDAAARPRGDRLDPGGPRGAVPRVSVCVCGGGGDVPIAVEN